MDNEKCADLVTHKSTDPYLATQFEVHLECTRCLEFEPLFSGAAEVATRLLQEQSSSISLHAFNC